MGDHVCLPSCTVLSKHQVGVEPLFCLGFGTAAELAQGGGGVGANSLFFDSHVVVIQGASSELVQFWESKGMMTPQRSISSPQSRWPKARTEIATPPPTVVEVAAPKEESDCCPWQVRRDMCRR